MSEVCKYGRGWPHSSSAQILAACWCVCLLSALINSAGKDEGKRWGEDCRSASAFLCHSDGHAFLRQPFVHLLIRPLYSRCISVCVRVCVCWPFLDVSISLTLTSEVSECLRLSRSFLSALSFLLPHSSLSLPTPAPLPRMHHFLCNRWCRGGGAPRNEGKRKGSAVVFAHVWAVPV